MPIPVLWGLFAKAWARRVARRKELKMKEKVVAGLLKRVLSFNALANYRRLIGAVLIGLGALVALVTNPDLLALCIASASRACGWLSWAQPYALALGGYLAAVGVWLRKVKYIPAK